MTDKPTDRELDDYLAGRSPLSARYRDASRETTTPALDAAILSQARSAVRPPVVLAPVRAQPSKPARLPWQQRWAVPVGIAATLLIGVDLAWRVSDRVSMDEKEQAASVRLDEAPVESAPMVAMAPSPAAESLSAPAAPAVADAAKATTSEESVRGGEVARDAVAGAPPAEPFPEEQVQQPDGAAAEVTESFADAMQSPMVTSAAPEIEAEAEADRVQAERGETLALQSMQRQEAEAKRERAQAERRAYAYAPAPPAAAAKAAPAPVAPRRDADAAAFAAVDLARLLRAADGDGLRERYAATQLTRQALADAAAVFADDLRPRLSQDEEGVWRADYLDAGQRLRCTARLRPTVDGWQLEGLVTRPR